jgi:hypothetical protein
MEANSSWQGDFEQQTWVTRGSAEAWMSFYLRKEEEADLRLRLFLLLPVALPGRPQSKWRDQVCGFAANT